MELFWQTIADYNTMTWPVQALIVLAAVVLTARLYLRPTLRVKTAMKCFLAFLNAWIAVAYYLVRCAGLQRSHGVFLGRHGRRVDL